MQALRRNAPLAALVLVAAAAALPARAWIYPEHRSIAGTAVSGLSNEDRAALDALWAEARTGYEARLCDTPWAGDQGPKPVCVDWSAFPAIAGDHSCSAGQMLRTATESDWILKVAGVCSRLEVAIATAKNPIQLRNRLVKSDLELQRADKEYASRAGANNVHFLLARKSDDGHEYILESIRNGGELNAIGTWIRAHAAAMRLARELASGNVPPEKRPEVARRALALEAYGLHFLEDAFASGHVAGTWGDVATRKGTHDYYNEHGLDTRTWSGSPIVIYGDARMRDQDRERAAETVRLSVRQLLEAAKPGSELGRLVEDIPLQVAEANVDFDTCKSMKMPDFPRPSADVSEALKSILGTIPVAGRATEGALPRFRSEVGPFVGVVSSLRGAFASGGLDSEARSTRFMGTMDIGVRLGIGLDALLGDMGDGQIFLQGGVSYSGKQTATCSGCTGPEAFQELFPRLPARTGISVRFRMPFWLIPGDLLVATPFLAFTSPHTLAKMGIGAANGGLIPWQAGFSTFLGRMQFCLGREFGATFYGYSGGEDKFLAVGTSPEDGTTYLAPVALRSVDFDLPILEIRPFRDFGQNQSSAVFLQIGAGADVPTKVTVLAPSTKPEPDLAPSYYGYLKLQFDWRRYW